MNKTLIELAREAVKYQKEQQEKFEKMTKEEQEKYIEEWAERLAKDSCRPDALGGE